MTGDRDWSAPNHMLDRLNWRYQFDYEICDPVIQLIAISARTAILLRAMFLARPILRPNFVPAALSTGSHE